MYVTMTIEIKIRSSYLNLKIKKFLFASAVIQSEKIIFISFRLSSSSLLGRLRASCVRQGWFLIFSSL